MTVAAGEPVTLYGPWCVEENQTLDFNMQLTLKDKVSKAQLRILQDDMVVAQAAMDDSQEPSSMSLLYRAKVTEDSEFSVVLEVSRTDTIPANGSQMGFKIFGDCYSPVTNVEPG